MQDVEPAWVTEVCSLARDVKELMKDQRLPTRSQVNKGEEKWPITCYRCAKQVISKLGAEMPRSQIERRKTTEDFCHEATRDLELS